MPFELVAATSETGGTRDAGDNILLSDLSAEYKVYCFYYPPPVPDQDFENKLRDLGSVTGKNLLINIGRFNDPQFDRIVELFGIKKYPVIVMTAIEALASSQDEPLTAFARIDSEHLLT